jgi:hypothetical protein
MSREFAQTNEHTSTADLLWTLLRDRGTVLRNQNDIETALSDNIVHIVTRDCETLLQCLGSAIQRIRILQVFDRVVLSSLSWWQWVLSQHLRQVWVMDSAISWCQGLQAAIAQNGPAVFSCSRMDMEAPGLFVDGKDNAMAKLSWLRGALSSIGGSVTSTSSSIVTSVALLESMKQAQEQSSVSKLTVLAFIFIPLSFVSSLLSVPMKVSCTLAHCLC